MRVLMGLLLAVAFLSAGCSSSDEEPAATAAPAETAGTPPPQEPLGSTADNLSGAANPEARTGG